jgi:hypothetical protein
VVAVADELIYRGRRLAGAAGPAMVTVETPDGETIGVLRHVVMKSPTGFNWGYNGSGPAELARCLLLAALDNDRCLVCGGDRWVVYDVAQHTERRYQPGVDPQELALTCGDCDGGYRRVPYQTFKEQYVCRWGDQWRVTRSELLGWLRDHGVEA